MTRFVRSGGTVRRLPLRPRFGGRRFGIAVVLLASAAAAVAVAAGSAGTAAVNPKSVGAALLGPKNDGSYNQSVYTGLVRAKAKFGIKLTVVDNVSDKSKEIDVLRGLAQKNALVVAASTTLTTSVARVAQDFPNVQFVVVGGRTKPTKNIHFVDIAPRAGGYLIGTVAATLTKTNTIGYVGGVLIPPTTETEKGYKLGAAATNKGVKVQSVIVGSFADPVKAKQAAAAQIASGADVIFGWLDAGYPGVLQAIRESGKPVVGFSVAVSKCKLGSEEVGDHILAYDAATYNVVRDSRANKLQNHIYGLEDPSVQRLQLCPKYNTPAVRALIAKNTKAIVSGQIKLGG
jgi:basic membrane protein A